MIDLPNIYLIRIDENRSIINYDVTVFGVDIPKGFITDGASVPILFRWYMSPYGKGLWAALAHDYKHIQYNIGSKERDQADKEFYFDLIKCGYSKITALFPYYGVRLYTIALRFRKKLNEFKMDK